MNSIARTLSLTGMAALLVAACHSGSGGSTLPAAAPPTCDAMADHVMTVMSTKGAPADMVAKIRGVLVERCTADAWGADVRGCLGGIKSIADGDHCQAMLTQPQRDALEHASETLGAPEPATDPAAPPPLPPTPSE